MKRIYVNLKRFDVPGHMGGICPSESPVAWMEDVIHQCMDQGLGTLPGVKVTLFLPEALLHPALLALESHPLAKRGNFGIGCQAVHREDVAKGGNFGAFTANRPAAAMAALGCGAAMIGHSEERRDKLELLACYDESVLAGGQAGAQARRAVNGILAREAECAISRGMDVMFCLGETAEEKGSDDPAVYQPRVRAALGEQMEQGLAGLTSFMGDRELVLAYEPVWAIGPGKTPPGADYIGFVSAFIKEKCRELMGKELPVLYGGGLKEENAPEIAGVTTVDGGLVALTKFTQPIGFDVASLKRIIEQYVGQGGQDEKAGV